MKFLGWILLLSVSSHAFAQGVEIEPAPLSVEDDGTRKIINRIEGETAPVEKPKDVIAPPAAEALVIPNDDVINPPAEATKPAPKKSAKTKAAPVPKVEEKPVAVEVIPAITPVAEKPVPPVNPIDGQLKLEGPAATPATVENKTITPSASNVSDDLFPAYQSRVLSKYLQFSFGFLNSKYEKIHPSLDNGSSMMSFKFVADISARVQTGFGIEVLSDKSGQTVPDSIRVLQYRIFADYHAPLTRGAVRLDWVAGLGLSAGDFGIKRRYINDLGQEVSVKLKDGIIVGLIPVAGVRIFLFDQNSFDVMVEYHQYFSTPQKHIGGLAIAPRFSFEF